MVREEGIAVGHVAVADGVAGGLSYVNSVHWKFGIAVASAPGGMVRP
jgi:hypothetical protein